MADIQSADAEIRREKKKEQRTNDRMKNIMVCPITQDDHNKRAEQIKQVFDTWATASLHQKGPVSPQTKG